MIEGRPSRTAQRVAMRRAAHQLFDNPKVFDDPLALRMAGPDAEQDLFANLESERPARLYLRAFMAVRSRVAEDQLAPAVAHGATQYVVLGAGLDTFAYRNPYPALRVFEADHPATQAWKRERLREMGIGIPDSVVYAPVDFERQQLAEGLEAAGLDFNRITFFAWLGVVPYLTPEAATAILRFIGAMPKGSGVTFDYSIPPSSLNGWQRAAFDVLAARVAAAGEPFQLFFDLQQPRRLGWRRTQRALFPEPYRWPSHGRRRRTDHDGLGLIAATPAQFRGRSCE